MLEVQIHAKTFRSSGRQILRDIGFVAEAGEVLALLGPSGIGKSTVLRILLGLEHDFQGHVRLPAGRVGVMFQEPRLPPWLTVEDTLRLVQPSADVASLLREVRLPGVEKMLPSALSLGMARRVALARALAVEPTFLVLDEPFASLDQDLSGSLGKRLADRAATNESLLLLSTHDVDQALAMATRILVLSGEPATLAADLAVTAGEGQAANPSLRQELLARFAFLGGQSPAPA